MSHASRSRPVVDPGPTSREPLRPAPQIAVPGAVHRVAASDELAGLQLGPDDVFVVPTFEVLEGLVQAGIDSGRILVAADGDSAWYQEHASAVRPLEPPRPYRFGERVLVIVPTYDEVDNLELLVRAIERWLVCDVLVVDDSSPDGTGVVADRLAASRPWMHVLHRPTKQGLGRAYVAGFAWGLARGYDRLFEMDADFSHPPHDLPRLVHASATADLVVGSRYVCGGDTGGWTWFRRAVSRAGNAYARLWLRLPVRDLTAGFRCYHAELLRRIDLAAVVSDGYAFQVEMAWRAQRASGVVRELPIRFVDRRAGHSKMSLRIALEAVRKLPRLGALG